MDTVGFTCGTFDLLHAGHAAFLAECVERCDVLIVGLQTDPSKDRATKHHPVQTMFERFLQLRTVSGVAEIIPYDTESDLLNLLAVTKIDVRFLGSDYAGCTFTGDELGQKLGIRVEFIPRYHNFSSSELRTRVHVAASQEANDQDPFNVETDRTYIDDSDEVDGWTGL